MSELDLNAIKAHHERTLADDDRLTISEHERGLLLAEVERVRAHILDIAAHATPYGDLPDDPGYVGTYLLTAGALHRALGIIGHTAPSCQAEAERDEQARDRHRWRTRAEKAEAERDALKAERDEARAEARRHLEHLRIAHPDHFTPNVLGERLCGCGGQWPCPNSSAGRDEQKRRADWLRGHSEWLSAERDALKALATEVLGHFTHPGHPGEPCRRTGWIRDRQIAAWRAALDTPTPCKRCGGSKTEPGSLDYDTAVHMVNPYTGEPCSACNGTGKAVAAEGVCGGCATSLAACRAEGAHCCDLCDHTPEETSDGR